MYILENQIYLDFGTDYQCFLLSTEIVLESRKWVKMGFVVTSFGSSFGFHFTEIYIDNVIVFQFSQEQYFKLIQTGRNFRLGSQLVHKANLMEYYSESTGHFLRNTKIANFILVDYVLT